MDEALRKPEKDFSAQTDAQLPIAEKTAKSGALVDALESLAPLEKLTRNGADTASNTRILVANVTLCYAAGDWKLLGERVVLLSKKHGLLKPAVTKMIQEAMALLDKAPNMATKLELIETLRTVTDGKIFVEVERARLTRTLSKIREDEGKIAEACDILQELQVETFGSMEKREKTEFILDQMRLSLAKNDHSRAQITSRKISTKFFEDPQQHDLKIRFYEQMIQLSTHESNHLNTCKYFRHIYDTPRIKENEKEWLRVLQNVVFFIILSPYDNEQSDLIHRIYEDSNLEKTPLLKDLVKCFITNELMRWPKIEEIYGPTLKATNVFDKSEAGQKRLKALHERVIEHNVRVIAKYYTRISVKRLTQLLDLSAKDAEEFLSKLVVSKTIYAKMDRPAGVINFVPRKNPNVVLNEWSSNISQLLGLISKTTHLIAKEEMVASITESKN
ncbi:26S proteasome non-ATPase regulatory subunit 12 [Entophlyctis luteolus]|nr:26S proteasome non-ATPase regulatory subunit 12 [Entophlyctis luteolus]KAJ3347320.1 26S proteasome non-ATPase regulatory subunit 12 [Entophlyctis luteolus]KAJ3387935.1 26S proteasome non-ATPase regulatory subunit 12 [Entophlyctis sp. JEL0112]